MGEYLILKGHNKCKVIYLTWTDVKDHMGDYEGHLYHVSDICEIGSIDEHEKLYAGEIQDLKSKHDTIMRWKAGLL